MAVLDILQDWREDASVLHRKTVRIRKVDRRIAGAERHGRTMREAEGVGLAAPQVGRNLSALSSNTRPRGPGRGCRTLQDPQPQIAEPRRSPGPGGLLSVPGFLADVDRAERITIKGMDADGKAIRIKADGWLARIFQHEIDHLNGILMMDRANRLYTVEEGEDGEPVVTPIGAGHEEPESTVGTVAATN